MFIEECKYDLEAKSTHGIYKKTMGNEPNVSIFYVSVFKARICQSVVNSKDP